MKIELLEEERNLRILWPNEAIDFTPWLADNIELLGNEIGIDMSVCETESQVGDFNVDIFATEMGTDRKIIIENQLECTNHDHLGKIITYAAGKSADIIVWIVKNAREEHKAAIEWLNNHTEENIGFFLCELKAYRIGKSDPAVKIVVVEKPNDWAKIVKNNVYNEIELERYKYWVEFKKYAFQNKEFLKHFKLRNPTTDHWYNFSIGSSECNISVSQIRKRSELEVELYISDNKELFHELYKHKEEIELATNLSFKWLELPDRKASRIIVSKKVDFDDEKQWPEQFDWIIETMIKMKREFSKYWKGVTKVLGICPGNLEYKTENII